MEAMAARMASIGAARPYKQNFSDVKAGVKLTTKSRLPPVSFYRYRYVLVPVVCPGSPGVFLPVPVVQGVARCAPHLRTFQVPPCSRLCGLPLPVVTYHIHIHKHII